MERAPLPEQVARLEQVFTRIHETSMAEVPVSNPALEVQSVGFRPWGEDWLGVLITPRFMNLVLLPGEASGWSNLRVGSTRTHAFPSGLYDFLLSRHEDLGPYQIFSLFSPMFDFADQQAAVSAAMEALNAIVSDAELDQPFEDGGTRGILRSDPGEQPPRTFSRRSLLRGKLSDPGVKPRK